MIKTILWAVMVLLALGVGLYALAFFFFFDLFNPDFQARFELAPVSARLHIIPGGLALILGGFQFSNRLRSLYPVWHRSAGTVYVLAVIMGGVGGMLLAPNANGGAANSFGFASLAVLWLYSIAQAYRYARQRSWIQHQRWMIRNYALTLAAVGLRLELPLLQMIGGMDFDAAYAIVAWLCWIPNLIIAEWFLVEKIRQPMNATESTSS